MKKFKYRHNGQVTDFFNCKIGVRQGDNLSPLLFAIFINDFNKYIGEKYSGLTYASKLCNELLSDSEVEVFIKLFTLLYADDTIIMAESPEELQKALTATAAYCEQWGLKINPSKSKIMIFSRENPQKTTIYHQSRTN
jgi:hypothetical protein